ncbi:hypothetical protein [Streptomyces sp. NPDC093970]|uniref:hypothetical protein n=1 Tax=Streptomyces sp. NPDC093970 TaxID=3155076 RepID=UPI0034444C54
MKPVASRVPRGTVARAGFALLPLVSLGLLCNVPSLVLALRRRSRADWWAFAGFSAVLAAWVTDVELSPADSHGLLQDASSKTHARVSYAQVIGEQNTGNARPFLNGLLQRSCDVVLAVGRPEAAVAAQAAPVHRDVGFVLVGDTAAAGTNVTAVRVGAGLRADVGGAVERAVEARG